jgi:hypothetical protein
LLQEKNIKVGAFMTAPRYCNTWARNIIDASLKRCGIPLVVSGGVFYGQCMQRMLEDAIEIGVDLAITVDFDSIFTPADVMKLINTISARSDIDALASMQSRRGMPYPLFTNGGYVAEFQGDPIKVDTAHFGLTAIKLDRLKDIPKPWFLSQPDENGQWLKQKIDDDVYFWHKWRDNDRTLYVDHECSIGHMEEMISLFDGSGKHTFVYPNDWYEENMK